LTVQKWYWCGQSNVVHVDESNEEEGIDYGEASGYFEPTARNRNIGIRIRDLTKVD